MVIIVIDKIAFGESDKHTIDSGGALAGWWATWQPEVARWCDEALGYQPELDIVVIDRSWSAHFRTDGDAVAFRLRWSDLL